MRAKLSGMEKMGVIPTAFRRVKAATARNTICNEDSYHRQILPPQPI